MIKVIMQNLNIEPIDPKLWAHIQKLYTPRVRDAAELDRIETERAEIIRKLVDSGILRKVLKSTSNKGDL